MNIPTAGFEFCEKCSKILCVLSAISPTNIKCFSGLDVSFRVDIYKINQLYMRSYHQVIKTEAYFLRCYIRRIRPSKVLN
jgi:hypothetical protein